VLRSRAAWPQDQTEAICVPVTSGRSAPPPEGLAPSSVRNRASRSEDAPAATPLPSASHLGKSGPVSEVYLVEGLTRTRQTAPPVR